ncbi:MAG: hypothetical protein AB7O52_06075 [Planctomycetota bacterium]
MLKRFFAGAAFAGLALCSSATFAGSPYTIAVGSASGSTGGMVTVESRIQSTGVGAIALQGWSYGVCHTSAAIDVVMGTVATGSDVATINGGAMPGFESRAAFPGAGWTQGVVIDLFGVNVLPAGSDIQAATAQYSLAGPSGNYSLTVCDTLGAPPVAAVVVESGASLTPNFAAGSISILSPNFLTAGSATAILTAGTVDSDILLTNVDPVAAAQVALTYDDALITPASAAPVGPAATAGFFELQPGSPSGELAIGLVMDFGDPLPGIAPIPAGTDVAIATITWTINPLAPTPSSSPLVLTDGIGSPAVSNLLVFADAGTESPNLVDGAINIVNFNPFLRGDCNADVQVDIADGVYLLNFLFQSGPDPVCDDACDFNDDGSLDATDAIQTFNYVLGLPVGSEPPPPAAPGPFVPGIDGTTGDGLGCNGDADD